MNSDTSALKHKKVFIFGAGLAGTSALAHLDESVTVLGFVDNDKAKVGKVVAGYRVYSPQHLNQSRFDLVLIASEYFEQISQQLIIQCALSKDDILVLPARMIKSVAFEQSTHIQSNALNVLFTVTQQLNQEKVNYYVDAGTLLGIYRDGQLIPWDDDLDLAVNASDLAQVKTALNNTLPLLQDAYGTAWEIREHTTDTAFGAVPQGAVRGFKLKTIESREDLPMMDVFVKYVGGATMDYTLASRGISMPSKHILSTVSTVFMDQVIRFPFDVEGYLAAHYGDWQTPVRDWNLGMIKSATVF